MTACKFCQAEISWTKSGEKSVPTNPDGTPHRCKKAEAAAIRTLIGRVTEHDASNVHLGSKIFFLSPENRKAAQDSFPVGAVVRLAYEKGTCKGMEKATGTDLEKFLKEEGEQRTMQPSAAVKPEEPKDTCTSPVGPVEPRRKGPIEENRMPTREELLAMVNSYDTYWKAKTLMDIQVHEEIRQQVEWGNWQECVSLANQFKPLVDCSNDEIFIIAREIHDFIRKKVGGEVP